MKIADKFEINTYSYGYAVSEHIVGKKNDKVVDYWGNNKYFGNLKSAKAYIVERYSQMLMDNNEFVSFFQSVDKMEQLKKEIISLEIKKGTKEDD